MIAHANGTRPSIPTAVLAGMELRDLVRTEKVATTATATALLCDLIQRISWGPNTSRAAFEDTAYKVLGPIGLTETDVRSILGARWRTIDQDERLRRREERAMAAAVQPPSVEDEPVTPTFLTLTDLMARPELLQPPEAIIPRLAYRGRLSVLAGPDKGGKSTLMRHAVTRLTVGHHFLGERCGGSTGRVLWCGLEEAVGDAVREFSLLAPQSDKVLLVTMPTPNLAQQIREVLSIDKADLLLIDSLTEFARITAGQVPVDGDSSAWADVVRPLVSLAREFDIAVVVLHHVRKSDGKYRGSTEIAAAADALYELALAEKDEDPAVRHISGRGRWPIEPFTVALRNGSYSLDSGGTVSLDARVLIYVKDNPGCSKTSVREGVTGRAGSIDDALANLVVRGALRLVDGRYQHGSREGV